MRLKNLIKNIAYESVYNILKIKYKRPLKSIGVNQAPRQMKVIVSLTTIPSRINDVWLVIESIFRQTIKADRVLLWISREEFENVELPEQLIQQKKRGLEIRYCDDIKPHKKYYYTMQENPDDIIITVDDDVFYSKLLIKKLLASYKRFPSCVSCMRAHRILLDDKGNPLTYKSWKQKVRAFQKPAKDLIAIGVGGILYPPHSMDKEVFNKNALIKYSLFADDLWLKCMQTRNNTKVTKANRGRGNNITLAKSQETALFQINKNENRNDVYLKQIISKYHVKFN